jgi:hypothetical protein
MMKSTISQLFLASALCLLATLAPVSRAAEGSDPFLGAWALTIPDGGAGWLNITRQNGYYDGEIMWGAGSVVPVESVFFTDNTMFVGRLREEVRRDSSDKPVRTNRFMDVLMARIDDDALQVTRLAPRSDGNGVERVEFTGKRQSPLPPKPDLAKVTFGEPVNLFNGKDLTGWKTFGSEANGWRAENGMLVNHAPQEPGKHKSYANIRTEAEFEDFKFTCEFRLPPNGNSGIYLRGWAEVQVADAYGKPASMHSIGAIYSRILPTENAAKPAGEWQKYEISFVNRHANVVLNGKTVIANQPVLGCTGGALSCDPDRPGPIYLQGDHTSVEYRNLMLYPVKK